MSGGYTLAKLKHAVCTSPLEMTARWRCAGARARRCVRIAVVVGSRGCEARRQAQWLQKCSRSERRELACNNNAGRGVRSVNQHAAEEGEQSEAGAGK